MSIFRQYINSLINENLNEEENYENYRTSVIALFNKGKLLILQRGSTAPWMPNKWSLVGGVVDEGENEFDTILRETSEEIGQSPKNVKFVEQVKTVDSGTIFYYIGMLQTDSINLDYENQAYKFISVQEVNKYDFVPHVKDFIIKSFDFKK